MDSALFNKILDFIVKAIETIVAIFSSLKEVPGYENPDYYPEA